MTASSLSDRSRRAERGRRRNRPASPATTSPSTSTGARSPAPTARPAPPGSRPPPWRPYTAARFTSRQCDPCPDRPACTRGKSARTVNFLPRHLYELQATNRTDQQDPHWKRLYATRSGIEGTICELVNAHRARRSRYHGHRKTHAQHVLTGIAINIERLASRAHHHPRGLTAFQLYLDSRDLTWECW
ncbi:transposase [Streptomyces prasinus]|uniref:transposase n=1 Tax=Streptomyces prasinus TaxID=67345 RepID=UPI00362BEF3D